MHLICLLPPSLLFFSYCYALFSYDTITDALFLSPNLSLGANKRGAQCGPSANGASCAQGLCCSQDGLCGTGGYYCDAPACLFQYGPACDANQTPSGPNTSSVPRLPLGNLPYGVDIRHCSIPGKVALTFDDGPYIWTSDLLDILKANNVKATFFIVGNNGGKGQINDPKTGYPAVIQRMYAEGHQIGSHTWSHQDLSTLNHQQRMDQIVKNEIAFVDILGFFPTYLRPPYESCNSDCMSDLGSMGYHVLNYDVDTLDWQENYQNSQQIFLNTLQSGKPATNSFIELTHDIHNGTVHGFAQFMIDNLTKLGYATALVGDCLQDPRANWYRNPVTGQAWNNATASSSANAFSSSARPAKAASSTTMAPSNSTPTGALEGAVSFGGDIANSMTSTVSAGNSGVTSAVVNSTTAATKSEAFSEHILCGSWWSIVILAYLVWSFLHFDC